MKTECPPLNENTVKSMKGNRRKDTKPEMVLRKALRDAGFPGYRLQWKVPGRPNICYPGRKIAIYVNGCFWHRCPVCDLPLPKHNREFWEEKFRKNVERDQRYLTEMQDMGWTTVVVWECRIKKDLESVIGELTSILSETVNYKHD